MRNLHQTTLIVSTIAGSWLGMQAVHELGHVVGAYATGGRVARVVLHPLRLSRTDLAQNPRPLVVAWAGPLGGVLGPLGLWGIAAVSRGDWAFLPRFFAGFCAVANGAYIGCGAFAWIGDAQQLRQHGAPVPLLAGFGIVCVALGLWLWHGQGRHFGLGPNRNEVRPGMAYASASVCAGLILLGIIVDGA